MADLDELALSLPQATKEMSTTVGRRIEFTASCFAASAAAGRTPSTRRRANGSQTS
jgi:hypothetical protein